MRLALALGACVLLATISDCFATDPTGKWADSPYADWFKAQKMDLNPSASCCGEADGHEVIVRQDPAATSGYDVQVDGRWVPVNLPHVYHDNPTGKNIAWYVIDVNSGIVTFYCLRLRTST